MRYGDFFRLADPARHARRTKSMAMTLRYSHLSADFRFEALERLVAKPAQTPAEQPTETSTDTGASLQVEAQPAHVQ
jgi:hypothetical protein